MMEAPSPTVWNRLEGGMAAVAGHAISECPYDDERARPWVGGYLTLLLAADSSALFHVKHCEPGPQWSAAEREFVWQASGRLGDGWIAGLLGRKLDTMQRWRRRNREFKRGGISGGERGGT